MPPKPASAHGKHSNTEFSPVKWDHFYDEMFYLEDVYFNQCRVRQSSKPGILVPYSSASMGPDKAHRVSLFWRNKSANSQQLFAMTFRDTAVPSEQKIQTV